MKTRAWFCAAIAALMTLTAAGCGNDDSSSSESPTVRIAYNPEPTIQWMEGQGIVKELEDEYGITLDATETYEPGPAFLSNRADVISVGSFEIAAIEEETGIKTVTFGESADNPYVVVVQADDPAQTMADLRGDKVAARGGGSGPLTASILARALHDLDFPPEGGEGGDFQVVLSDDHLVNAGLLARGDVRATLLPFTIAAPYVRRGEFKALYDGKIAPDILGEKLGMDISWGNNNLVAREDWFEANPEKVAFMLALYDRAAKEWVANREEIMEQFPTEFDVEDPADLQAILEGFETRDLIPETAYIDEEFVAGEEAVIDLMKDIGFLDQSTPMPRFETVQPQ